MYERVCYNNIIIKNIIFLIKNEILLPFDILSSKQVIWNLI